jgi:hypothetical protein
MPISLNTILNPPFCPKKFGAVHAEKGGMGGEGLWRPVSLGIRPTYESEAMEKYLAGAFVGREGEERP